MPRRGRAPKREIEPDVKHNSELVAKLINKIMQQGKKSLAERTVYSAFDIMEERMDKDPVELFEQAVENATPVLEVRPRRVGGATYQIPMEVRPERRLSLAIRWLVDATRNRPGYDIEDKLAAELMDAANNTGAAVRKKEEMHRMAEANKAFAHYRW